MEHDLLSNLSPEIIIDILSRLSIRTIQISKCVCKSWLDLLETDDFVKFHFSESVPALAVWMGENIPNWCEVFDFEHKLDDDDDDDDDAESSHNRRYNPLTKFDFPHEATFEGSANGLLLLYKLGPDVDSLYICNPITRHYVEICCLDEFDSCGGSKANFAIGASKIGKQHKVVLITHEAECHVYTLRTGSSWRRLRVEAGDVSLLKSKALCSTTLVDGFLYWKVTKNLKMDTHTPLIACFDVETECFSSFPAPSSFGMLSVLRDCLCFCESKYDKIVMWLMKDYGVEKCWMKEYVIGQGPKDDRIGYDLVYPIKVFENGDILMLRCGRFLFYYSIETKTIQEIPGVFTPCEFSNVRYLTPSFLSLRGLGMENVISF